MSALLPSVLVLGGTGFIGRALISGLIEAGFPVSALVLESRNQQKRLSRIAGLGFVSARSAAAEDLDAALEDHKFAVVINLAAAGVRPDDRAADILYTGNAGFLLNMLSALRNNPPRLFIHTGSWFEYGQQTEPVPITEQTNLLTKSLYGSAKAAALIMGAAHAHSIGIPFVALRLFHVYGPGESEQRLIPYLKRSLQKGDVVALTSGQQIRDFVYLSDVVDAYKHAILAPDITSHTVYNVCTAIPGTVRHMCEEVADVLGASRNLLQFGKRPDRQDEALWGVGSNQLFCEVTGWTPRVDMASGIRKMIASCNN